MATIDRELCDDAGILPRAPTRLRWKTRARACALIVACALSGLGPGCGDDGGATGGGPGGGAGGGTGGGGAPAEAEVVLTLDADSAGTLVVSGFTIIVDEIRLRSDRGIDLDPVLSGVGPIDLVAGGQMIAFLSAPPATYSSVDVVLDGGSEPTLVAALTLDGTPVEITIAGPIALDFACEVPVATEPGDHFVVELDLDLEALATLLEAATLPPEQDGIIVVDASTAPDLVADIVAWLEGGWIASCEASVVSVEPDSGIESSP